MSYRKIFSGSYLFLFILLMACVSACAPTGIPRAAEGTLLRKIQDRGQLIVGVRYELPAFGYLNPKTRTLEGFEVAIAHEIASYIFADANKIDFKEAITKDRIPFLQSGTVDLVISNFIITEERLKDVDFSVVYYQTGGKILVNENSLITSVGDLAKGKKVATTKGSAYITPLQKLTQAELVLYDTNSEATEAMIAGKVDAVSNNDATLLGMTFLYPKTLIVGAYYSTEYFGVGVAKNNPELLNVVNTVIRNLKSSGKWKEIWKKEIGDKVGIQTLPDPPLDEWRR